MANPRSDPAVLIYEAISGGGAGPGDLPASWLAEGTAIRRALVRDFAAVPGVRVVEPVDARAPDAANPAPPGVDRIVTDPARPIEPERLVWSIHHAVLVAPEADGALEALARRVEATGNVSRGPSPDAISLCADKLRLADHLARAGVPTPPTRAFCPADGLPAVDSPSGRVVVKPVDGAGAVDTFVLDAGGRCPPAIMARRVALIQPYRPGPAWSASFLVGRDGRAHLIAVGRQHVAIGPSGAVRYEGGEVPVAFDPAALVPVWEAIESIPKLPGYSARGLLGFVGVDFIAGGPAGGIEVLEINPRVTTSIVGLTRLAAPGTIARAWLIAACYSAGADLGADFRAIRAAPSVRFGADGSILAPQESG